MLKTKKEILILGKGSTKAMGQHSSAAQKMYSINFTENKGKYSFSLHYNGANSYLFGNATEITKFKTKDYGM